MESQPQKPEFRINPDDFHPCILEPQRGHNCCNFIIRVVACDFQQCAILTSVDSDESVQPPVKLSNSK